MGRWNALAVGAGLMAYSLLSYGLMTHAPEHPWTVLALFGPLLLALGVAGWLRRHLPTLLGCGVLALLLLAVWRRGGGDLNRLYVLQHAALHAVFGWGFAVTLRPGATPLITALAERLHAQALSADERRYTRRVTAGWALYFVAMIGVSLALYALAPWPAWSFFSAVLTPVAAVAGFVGELLWRRWRHPEFEQVSVRRAIRAWREHDKT
jgi:uncharacterized membrane protein